MSSGSILRRPAVRNLLGLAVTVAAMAFVYQRVDLRQLRAVLAHAEPFWVVVSVLVFGLAGMSCAWRWHVSLRATDAAVHPGATVRYYWIGHFFNLILFGPAAGDVARSTLYAQRMNLPLPNVLASSPMDRLMGAAGVAILLALTLVAAGTQGAFVRESLPIDAPWPWALGVLSAVVLLLAGSLYWQPKSSGFLARVWRAFGEGVSGMAAQRQLGATALLMGFLAQVFLTVVLMVSLRAVTGPDLPWARMLWVFPVLTIASSLPSIGGLGVREGAAMATLGLYGVSQSAAVAASLLAWFAYAAWAGFGSLVMWREGLMFKGSRQWSQPRTISAVIPVLNEAESLPETLERLCAIQEITEIIVVDGGSRDETVAIAKEAGCNVIESPPGRGGQMRRGAAAATGDVVLLTHADTWLPAEAGRAALRALRDGRVVAGGFWKAFREPSWIMRGSRWRCASRLYFVGYVAGDQSFFVRREALEQIGGVPDMPLMEELELCKRLRTVGSLALAPATVTTSVRRFRKHGVVQTYLLMGWVLLKYRLGTSPEELRRIYDRAGSGPGG